MIKVMYIEKKYFKDRGPSVLLPSMESNALKRNNPRKQKQAKRLYGKSLIKGDSYDIIGNILLFSILMFPILAAGITLIFPLRPQPSFVDFYWNDAARYLAGMEIRGNSVLWPKTREPQYQEHVKFMDNLWGMIEKETIELIRPWRIKNIPAVKRYGTAFYPLSGADIINLFTLFPDSRSYIMVAMEQPGEAFMLRDSGSRRLIDGLVPVQRSIYLYGVSNYFQTKVMIREMNNALLPGTAPVLLIFMARLGCTIMHVENIAIDSSGTIVPLPALKTTQAAEKHIQGIRIYFTVKGEPGPRELVYLSMRLEANSVNPATPEGRFFNRLRNVKTMLKSAVYILQDKRYEALKNFILRKSVLVVQDDSGILFRDFNSGWDIKLYGAYNPVLNLRGCNIQKQDDLAASYRKQSFHLPFNFGYGILLGPGKSNLMVAKRK
jgi:hypothetical protein